MAKGVRRDWPSNDDLLALAGDHVSLNSVAERLGVRDATLRSHLKRGGIFDEFQARLRKEAVEDTGVSELDMLRQRVKEFETAAKKRRERSVFEERIITALEAAALERKPRYRPLAAGSRSRQPHEFVLLWSDLHAAEVVSREETNGINEYDWSIMLRRLDRMRRGVLSFQENRPYPVENLTVLALGDMLSGNIHDELAETNEMPLSEATVQLGLDSAAWLEEFVPHFKRIKVVGIVGNHPRAHHKPRAKQAFDNADWTMYQTLRLAMRKYESVEFEVPKASAWPTLVAGRWRVLALHGDGIRSSMPGVPWGGVSRRAAALQNQYTAAGQPIDLFALGHFHTRNLVESSAGLIAMNGSVKGVDEYSLRAFGSGRSPGQLLLTYHPRNGLTDASFLDLEDVAPAGAR